MPRYRHPVFTDAHLSRLEDIFQAVCGDFGCDLVEYNGEAEHVHLLLTYPDGATVPAGGSPSRASRPDGCGRSSLNWPGITGGPDGCGPAPTSPAASAVPR